MGDAFDLGRFVSAQAAVWDDVVAELTAEAKRGHWMWFVFPQVDGLGSSDMAELYAIRSIAEARAFLAHPLLGSRLRQAALLVGRSDRSAHAIFGSPDDLKLHASLTLFRLVAPKEAAFGFALQNHFDGAGHTATLAWWQAQEAEAKRQPPTPVPPPPEPVPEPQISPASGDDGSA